MSKLIPSFLKSGRRQKRRAYQYDPLPCKDSLRILSLKPVEGWGPLVVTLEIVQGQAMRERLANTRALSYVWGDSDRTEIIICNERTLKITSNLRKALEAIRDPNDEISVWADAVCINQEDLLERGHQIKLMTQIYSGAGEVLVWLGSDAGHDGSQAFQAVQILATDPLSGDNLVRDAQGGVTIQLLNKIIRCPWFHRMWTIQELGLAKSATLIWDESRTSWANLTHAFMTLERVLSKKNMERWGLDVGRLTTLYQWQSPTKRQTFLELLDMSTKQKTSDPRDRVFALLSHPSAQVQETANGPVIPLMEADYTMPETEVYTEIAANIIISTKRLDVLSYKHINAASYWRDHNDGLPSWAPYWTFASNARSYDVPKCLLRCHQVFHAAGLDRFSCWNGEVTKSTGRDQSGVPASSQRSLRVKAAVVGNIEIVYRQMWDTNSTPQDQLEAFEKMTARMERLKTISEEACYCMYRAASTCLWMNSQDLKVEWMAYWQGVWNSLPASTHGYEKTVDYAEKARRFFVTDTGYIGLCPEIAQTGDEVCILQGGRVPYVIRQFGVGEWELIGECYVSGTMHGEFVERTEGNGVEWEARTLV